MSRKRDAISESDEHNARGIELADRGWLDEAASEFRKAIKLDPASAHAHDNLATILAEQGHFLEALQSFMLAVQAEPDSPAVHHYLASFISVHGMDLAMSQYRKAIEVEYEFPDAHLNLALSLADAGQLTEALAELEIAHSQAPADVVILHELASCLIDLERYPEAIGHLKRLIKTHPTHLEALVDLGLAYSAQGFYAEAEGVFEKALQVDAEDFSAHYHLAVLYATWNRAADAFKHLKVAASQDAEKLRQWLREDRAFEVLEDDARYQALLESS